MADFMTILKVLFKSKFSFNKMPAKKRNLLFAGIALLAVLLIGMIGFYLYYFVPVFRESGLLNYLIFIVMLGVGMVTIIMGTVSMLVYVYFNRDTEFLSSLPVKPAVIFAAKFVIVYLTELIVSAVMLLPVMIFIGIFGKLGVLFYFSIPLIILIVPAVPLVIVSIVAIPLMYLVRFFKNKGVGATIFMILIFAGFFALYMWAVLGLSSFSDNVDNININSPALQAGITVLSYIFYPFSRLADFSTMESFYGLDLVSSSFINLGIALLSTAALCVLALLISSAVYYRGAAAQIENVKKNNAGQLNYKSSTNNVRILLKREWRDVTRNTAFGFQCLSGVILVPLMMVLFSILPGANTSSAENPELAKIINDMYSMMTVWLLMALGVGMNATITTAVSREGKNFAIFKTLPVTPREAVTAKLLLGYAISFVTVTVSSVVFAVLNKMDVMEAILLIVFMLAYGYAFCCFALWNDIRSPKLDWTAPSEVVKRSSKVYFPMLVNMALTIPLMLIYVFLIGIPWLKWLLLYIIIIGLAVGFDYILKSQTDKHYAKIEV